MKFLLDVGISPRLGAYLEIAGHSYRFVPDHYSNKLSDEEILEVARAEGEVILAHDLDFGKLLAFSGAGGPSVVVFRIHHISPRLFCDLLLSHWQEIETPLLNGALVVVEENSLRVRTLPIR